MKFDLDYGVAIEIEAAISHRGETIGHVGGWALSWPSSGTLRAVTYSDGEQVADPYLWRPDDAIDEVVAKALWKEARARSDDLQREFDEHAEPVRLQLVNG